MEELPLLNKIVDNYNDSSKLVFLGVSRDDSKILKQKFEKNHLFKFKIIPKSSHVDLDFCIMGYPKTFIIDKKGMVRKVYQYGINDSQLNEVIKLIDSCLAE